ncbi:MAG: hypothetical protein WD645_05625, partial [Dehalococcoidia bacterium]
QQGRRLDVLHPDTGERLTTLKLQAADVYGPPDSQTGLTAGAKYYGPGGITPEIIRNDDPPSQHQLNILARVKGSNRQPGDRLRSLDIRPSQLLALMQQQSRGGAYPTQYFALYGNAIYFETLDINKDRSLSQHQKTEQLTLLSRRAAELAQLYIENIEHFTSRVLDGQNPQERFAHQAIVDANNMIVSAAGMYANNPACAEACLRLTEWLSGPGNLDLSKINWRLRDATTLFGSLTSESSTPAAETLAARIGDFIASNAGLLRVNPENGNQHWVSPIWLGLASVFSRFPDNAACRQGLIQVARWINDLGWEHVEAYLPGPNRIVAILTRNCQNEDVRASLNLIAESICKRGSLANLYWNTPSAYINAFARLKESPASGEAQQQEYFDQAIEKLAGFVVDNHGQLDWAGSLENHLKRADFGRACSYVKDSAICQAVVPRIAERVNLRNVDVNALGEYAHIFSNYPDNPRCKERLTYIVDTVVNRHLKPGQHGQQVIKGANARCLESLLGAVSDTATPNGRRLAAQIAEQVLRAEPAECALAQLSPLSLMQLSAGFFHFRGGYDTDAFGRITVGIAREIIRRSLLGNDAPQPGGLNRDLRWLGEFERSDILLRSLSHLPANAECRTAAEIIATHLVTKGPDWLATLDNAALGLLATTLPTWSDIPACKELLAMVKDVYADAVVDEDELAGNHELIAHRLNSIARLFKDDQDTQAETLIRTHILGHVPAFSGPQLATIVFACRQHPDKLLFRQVQTQIAQHVASAQFDLAGLTSRQIGRFLSVWSAHPTDPDYREAAARLASLIAAGHTLPKDAIDLRVCVQALQSWRDEAVCRQAISRLAEHYLEILEAPKTQTPLDDWAYATLLQGFGLLADEDVICQAAGQRLLAGLAERLTQGTSPDQPHDSEIIPKPEDLSFLLRALDPWADGPLFARIIPHLARQARMLEIAALDGKPLALLLRNLSRRPEPACQEALFDLLKKIARSNLGTQPTRSLALLAYHLSALVSRDDDEDKEDDAAGEVPEIDEHEVLNALRPVLGALRQHPEKLQQADTLDVLDVLLALTAIPGQTRTWLEPLPGSTDQPTLLDACLERLNAPGLLAGTDLDTLGRLGAMLARLVASPAPSKEQQAQLLVFLMRDLRPQVEEKLALYE